MARLPGLAARLAAFLLVISLISSTPGGLFLGAAAQSDATQEIGANDDAKQTVQPDGELPVGPDSLAPQVVAELVDEPNDALNPQGIALPPTGGLMSDTEQTVQPGAVPLGTDSRAQVGEEEEEPMDEPNDTNSQAQGTGLSSLSGGLMKFIHHVTSLHVDDLFESKDEAEDDEEDEPADVFDGTEEEFEELIAPPQDDNDGSTNSWTSSSQQPPPPNGAATGGAEAEECPAIFPLPGCKPKKLPKCLPLGAFNQKWFSLSKKNWKAFLGSAWGKSMRANPKQVRRAHTCNA